MSLETYDVVVIGAGQAGLASAYYLRRAGVSFVLLDAGEGPGGAWRHAWNSLHLFSPASFSSLPGWMMPAKTEAAYPSRDEVIDYLTRYEERYQFPIERPVVVQSVRNVDDGLEVIGEEKTWRARSVLSTTGTWGHPFVPYYPGREIFEGRQLHSAHYVDADAFTGQRVAIVGGGNSGAQILAEVSKVAETIWVTPQAPVFLPDDVDGHVLFQRATARVLGGESGPEIGSLGDIVMVPPVRDARDRGVLGPCGHSHALIGMASSGRTGRQAISTPSSGAPGFAQRFIISKISASSRRTAGLMWMTGVRSNSHAFGLPAMETGPGLPPRRYWVQAGRPAR